MIHHGGAGTTAAQLRAGVPGMIGKYNLTQKITRSSFLWRSVLLGTKGKEQLRVY